MECNAWSLILVIPLVLCASESKANIVQIKSTSFIPSSPEGDLTAFQPSKHLSFINNFMYHVKPTSARRGQIKPVNNFLHVSRVQTPKTVKLTKNRSTSEGESIQPVKGRQFYLTHNDKKRNIFRRRIESSPRVIKAKLMNIPISSKMSGFVWNSEQNIRRTDIRECSKIPCHDSQIIVSQDPSRRKPARTDLLTGHSYSDYFTKETSAQKPLLANIRRGSVSFVSGNEKSTVSPIHNIYSEYLLPSQKVSHIIPPPEKSVNIGVSLPKKILNNGQVKSADPHKFGTKVMKRATPPPAYFVRRTENPTNQRKPIQTNKAIKLNLINGDSLPSNYFDEKLMPHRSFHNTYVTDERPKRTEIDRFLLIGNHPNVKKLPLLANVQL